MIHPERRRENLKKIEEMDKRDAEPLQPDWKTLCMNKKVDMVEVVRCKDCRWGEPTKNAYGEDRIICGNDDTYIDRYITVPADWYCADGERK